MACAAGVYNRIDYWADSSPFSIVVWASTHDKGGNTGKALPCWTSDKQKYDHRQNRKLVGNNKGLKGC